MTRNLFFTVIAVGWVGACSCVAQENLFREAKKICLDSGGSLDQINASAKADGWTGKFSNDVLDMLSEMDMHPTGDFFVKDFDKKTITLVTRQKTNKTSSGQMAMTGCELLAEASDLLPATNSAKKYFRVPPLKDTSEDVEWVYQMDGSRMVSLPDNSPETLVKYLASGPVYVFGIVSADGNSGIVYRKLNLTGGGKEN